MKTGKHDGSEFTSTANSSNSKLTNMKKITKQTVFSRQYDKISKKTEEMKNNGPL